MKKIDYKKIEKNFYQAKQNKIIQFTVPQWQFLMLDGEGDPNTSHFFKTACEILFSVSYKIKFLIKKSNLSIDYGVMPLEGLWWLKNGDFKLQDKENLRWTLMIRQPDFVTQAHVLQAIDEIKKPLSADIENLTLKFFDEGLSIQTLHLGPYANEQSTIDQLHDYMTAQRYQLNGKHHEIYLNDPTRVPPEKIKTILRQPVKSI